MFQRFCVRGCNFYQLFEIALLPQTVIWLLGAGIPFSSLLSSPWDSRWTVYFRIATEFWVVSIFSCQVSRSPTLPCFQLSFSCTWLAFIEYLLCAESCAHCLFKSTQPLARYWYGPYVCYGETEAQREKWLAWGHIGSYSRAGHRFEPAWPKGVFCAHFESWPSSFFSLWVKPHSSEVSLLHSSLLINNKKLQKRVLWTARRSNQSVLKEINPEYS